MWRSARGLGLVLLAGALCSLPGPAWAAGSDGAVVLRARFSASLPDRFGGDADGDGLIDLPNSVEYVRPTPGGFCGEGCEPRFTLRLDATASTAAQGDGLLAIESYRWTVTGPRPEAARRVGEGPQLDLYLSEGEYEVALEVEARLPWGTARAREARQVVVEDLLVVAIGDSYASGEGSPERARGPAGDPAQWADAPGDPAAQAAHDAAHRSTASWPAVAALALERADPATSVTFVSVAATRARVADGLLGPQPGIAVQGQLDQVAALVGDRQIDLLLVSVGGNDVGFARILRGLVDADRLADPICYGVDLQNVWDGAADGNWNRGSGLRWELPWGVGCATTEAGGRAALPGLRGLPAELDRLAAAIAERWSPGAVYLMGYPDPARSGSADGPCGEIVGDVTPPFRFHEVDRDELDAASARVVQPLNAALREAAERHGWTFVDGEAGFAAGGHGYCATGPSYADRSGIAAWYAHPADLEPAAELARSGVSWYRSAAQSVLLQGPADAWETMGTLHPNELGHLALARSLLAALPAD